MWRYVNPSGEPGGNQPVFPPAPMAHTVHAIIAPTLPVKVQAAMQFVAAMDDITRMSPTFDGSRGSIREMTMVEESAYESALMVVRLYFRGEMDYAEKHQVIPVMKTKERA